MIKDERPQPAAAAFSQPDPWAALTRFTPARIALGRAGASLATRDVLSFGVDCARARDAVHTALDLDLLEQQLHASQFLTLRARSQAADRTEFLRRPDLGRALHPESLQALSADLNSDPARLTVVIADGLSSLAAASHALPVLQHLRRGLSGWTLDHIILATQARVALADAIAQQRRSEAVIILIGERPGLKAPDSLGAYLTYRPRAGSTDADRNCVSNIRPGGLDPCAAAHRLLHLLAGTRLLQASGIALKDDSPSPAALPSPRNAATSVS